MKVGNQFGADAGLRHVNGGSWSIAGTDRDVWNGWPTIDWNSWPTCSWNSCGTITVDSLLREAATEFGNNPQLRRLLEE